MTVPPGFERVETAGGVLLVAERFRAEVLALELGRPAALEQWRASGDPVPGGRAVSVRAVLPRSGTPIHLRPLAHGGWLRGVTGRRFRTLQRPLNEISTAAALYAKGVRVPEPVFALGLRLGPFWNIEVATRFVEPSISLDRWLDEDGDADAIRAAGIAVRRFHDAGGSHGDLHVGNLLVDPNDPSTVTVVDLDRSRLLEPVDPSERAPELQRFARSLRKRHPRDAEVLWDAFQEGYEAAGPSC